MTTVHPPQNDHRAVARLSELADYVVPFTLRVICDLRIADHLAEGPRTVEDLAELTGSHTPTLQRALRALAGRGIFDEPQPGLFELTPLGQPLRSDHPASLREAYPLLAPEIQAWARLDHSVRTGQAAFDHAHGVGFWQYLTEHPDENERFNASQQAVTRRELRAVLPAYDWAALGTVVDVGGGDGTFLAGLLAAHPSVRGVLFDQPHVVSGAGPVLASHGVADRCEVVGGSFLDSVPAGGDAYVLKRVMYAWNDEQSTAMLRAIRAGMSDSSRLLLLEPLVQPAGAFSWGLVYDLLLVAMSGGGARTHEQIEALFGSAGLELTRVIETRMLPIIEARPS